jgi:LIVCS family branched-chain amino acid:cation transporter
MEHVRSISMKTKENSRSRLSATICMGLALFATQFGAGNLIFPPFLGRNTGSDWFIGFIGFFIMDVGLAWAAILSVVANREGNMDGVVGKIGRVPGKIMVTAIILCLGPVICIPRTAATTYEMGIKTLIPGLPQWVFSAIFFSVALLFVIRPAKVVDIIGKYLTPILLTVMVLLIVIGIISPIGQSVKISDAQPVHDGILNGYQTLDGIGGVPQTLMLITAAHAYGFKKRDEITKAVAGADIISAVILALVYGGLTYLGSTVSGSAQYAGLEQAPLLIAITNKLLGSYGVLALSIIVLMACLTTAVGLTSVAGNYFEELTHGKLKYKQIVIAVIVFSFAMSNFGLSKIISLAGPVLSILYPPLIVLVIGALLDRKIRNDRIAGCGAYAALIASVLEVTGLVDMSSMPLADYGLAWVAPALAGALVGAVFGKKNVEISASPVDYQSM